MENTTPAGSDAPLNETYDTALLDLDGVVYRGRNAVPHAVESLHAAAAAGMRLAYVTNNASRTPDAVAAHLAELGLDAAPADVVTAAQAVARLIAEQVPAGARVMVVGGDGLRTAVTERGLTIVEAATDDPAAVVQGYTPDTSWRNLAEVAYAVARGVPWFASNVDATMPTERGIAPGNGALVGAVAAATGGWPAVAGKPELPLHRETIIRTGARRPLVIGDRLDTDIEGAVRAGVPSLLVLTGVTDVPRLLDAAPERRPSYVATDLRGLLTAHERPRPDGGGYTCGGWRAAVAGEDDGALDLDGDGDVQDGLRALCAAAWTAGRHLDPTKALARLGLEQ